MGWSLSYQSPKEPELLEQFFVTIGKALYIANQFEAKCHNVLRISNLLKYAKQTNDLDAAIRLVKELREPMLANALAALISPLRISPEQVAILEKAKDARNFIAHEGAAIGPVYLATSKIIERRLGELRDSVSHLADGDNLVSRWIYEIEEKEAAPRSFYEEYPSMLLAWVFATPGEWEAL